MAQETLPFDAYFCYFDAQIFCFAPEISPLYGEKLSHFLVIFAKTTLFKSAEKYWRKKNAKLE